MSLKDDIPKSGAGRRIQLVDAENDDMYDSTERTTLLGAGTPSNNSIPVARKGNWEGFKDFEGQPWWRTPSVYWLVGPYFLFTLAFGGIIVPKLNLIIDLVCSDYFSERAASDPTFIFTPVVLGGDNKQCMTPGVQRSVATFTLVMGVITGTLSAITAPRFGALSERYGRLRLMCISSCGGILGEVITILAAKYPETVNYRWIILGSFFDGVLGSFTAGSVLGQSYTSDCTPPSKRGIAIGYLHACLFTGLAFGPLIAAYFVQLTHSLLSMFYVALGCHIFFTLFLWFVVPESVSRRRQLLARENAHKERDMHRERYGTWLMSLMRANPFEPLKILAPTGPRTGRLRRNLMVLAAIDWIIMSAAMGSGTVTVLYSEYMFNWHNFEASRYVSLVSMVRVVVLLMIFPVINYWFRIRPLKRRQRESGEYHEEKGAGADDLDVWLLRIALFSDVIGLTGYIFARSSAVFVLCGVITAFGGLGSAIITASLTKHVPAEKVGALLGAMGLLHAMGRVIAPILFNGLYAATVESFPQAFFVLLSSVFVLAFFSSFFVRPHVFFKDEHYVPPIPDQAGPPSSDALLEDEELPGPNAPRV